MGGVSFHRLAQRELVDGIRFYEIESRGLGGTFLGQIERCVRSIVEHPHAGSIVRGDVRRRLVRRFPYAILYSIRREGVRVLAVMNMKRRPMYWVGRE